MTSALLGVQLAVFAIAETLPGGHSVLGHLTAVRAQVATMKADLMAEAAPIWTEQMHVILQAADCPSGSEVSSNGVIQTIHNVNDFIFLIAWALVPGGFILGGILYFYGWNQTWKKRGLRLMVGALAIAAVILLWGAIANLIQWATAGSCAPST
jgi:hypothetical protein